MRILAIGIAIVVCQHVPATAEMYKIDNPASNIYNPASRMDSPNPLSPPTKPVQQPTVPEVPTTTEPVTQLKEQRQAKPKPNIPRKNYHYKTVKSYINSAKKAFNQGKYLKLITIAEDGLRRIDAGALKASMINKQKLFKYRNVGYEKLTGK